MNSHIDCEQFDLKNEESPLCVTEIETEPQAVKKDPKTDVEENDVHQEIYPISLVEANLNTVLEMECEQEYCEDYEKKVQYEMKHTEEHESNDPIVHNSCDSHKNEIQEVECIHIGEKMNTYTDSHLHQQSIPDVNSQTSEQHLKNNVQKSSSSIFNHNYVISDKKTFTCDFCSKSFSQKRYLYQHTHIHKNEKPFTCIICTKSFSRKSCLVHHTRTHTKERPFTCNVCERTFSQKCHLTQHTRIHTNEKPFTCTICSKSFAQKSTLVQHENTHANEKQFACNICLKYFSQKSYLTVHNRIHVNEKQFKCNICNKSFARKYRLTQHSRTHINKKQLKFNICGMQFSQKSHLNAHK